MRRYRHVPPVQFLQGFEAAARLGSFSKAAAELGLSQSAVSHQMRLLEDRLGQPLFLRIGRRVRLSDAGRDYLRTVRHALDDLESGHRRLAPYKKPGSVVIYAPREFAFRWLLPRLPALRQACPGSSPWIDTSERPVDFAEMEVSVSVLYAEAAAAELPGFALFADRIGPVLSPALAGRRRLSSSDLSRLPLLHSEHHVRWDDCFARAGIDTANVSEGLDFSDRELALAAAEAGLGVALASLPLAAPAIAAGRLAAPFGIRLEPQRSWFVASTENELADAHTHRVWCWLKQAAAQSPDGLPAA